MNRTQNPRRARPRRSCAPAALLLVLGASLLLPEARAGFLEDFYAEAGAQRSVTAAGVVESRERSLLTGGSLSVRTPRKDFTPFTLDAPRLKAGCGGIDLFLGAFSIPSREEFVSFLRSIGTAIPGLAFQLALQGLSPDLNEQVTQFRDMIMELTDKFSNSCEAASAVVDAAASATGWMTAAQHRAKNSLRSSGAASDASDADRLTRTNGAKVLESVPERTDSSGAVVEAAEMNLTWALLKGGRLGASLDEETLETMMTLLGTTLYVKTGSGANATVRATDVPGRDVLGDLLGAVGEASPAGARILRCDEAARCLAPAEEPSAPVNLVNALYEKATRYRASLLARSAEGVTDADLLLLANISSIPLVSLIETSASARIPAAGDSLLRLWCEAAAHEGVTAALRGLADDVRRLVTGSSARGASAISRAHAERLEARLAAVLAELRADESRIHEAVARAEAWRAQAAHIERSVWGRAASEAAARLPGLAGGGRL